MRSLLYESSFFFGPYGFAVCKSSPLPLLPLSDFLLLCAPQMLKKYGQDFKELESGAEETFPDKLPFHIGHAKSKRLLKWKANRVQRIQGTNGGKAATRQSVKLPSSSIQSIPPRCLAPSTSKKLWHSGGSIKHSESFICVSNLGTHIPDLQSVATSLHRFSNFSSHRRRRSGLEKMGTLNSSG